MFQTNEMESRTCENDLTLKVAGQTAHEILSLPRQSVPGNLQLQAIVIRKIATASAGQRQLLIKA
jgi:hypothetical protein